LTRKPPSAKYEMRSTSNEVRMDYVRFGVIAIAVFGLLWFVAWEFFGRSSGTFNGNLGTVWANQYSYIYVVCAFAVALVDFYLRRKAKKQ
jgi:hypothetical protein